MPSAVGLESCPMRGISMADQTETIRPNMAQLRTASLPIGSMYAIYGNIYHQYTSVMLAYIPATWILWVVAAQTSTRQSFKVTCW